MTPPRKPLPWFALALLLPSSIAQAQVQSVPVDNIREAFARFTACWKPPPPSRANSDIDITVIVSFNRKGEILGRPRITYESERATDNDRVEYRIAVMETLQRCTPMPFTDAMGGAVAGHPFAIRFHNWKPSPKPTEKRAWLTPKTL